MQVPLIADVAFLLGTIMCHVAADTKPHYDTTPYGQCVFYKYDCNQFNGS